MFLSSVGFVALYVSILFWGFVDYFFYNRDPKNMEHKKSWQEVQKNLTMWYGYIVVGVEVFSLLGKIFHF